MNILAVGAIALTAASCSDDDPVGGKVTPFRPVDLPAETRSAVTAGNDFSLSLFRTAPDEANCILSPYSVFSTLSMLANADAGEAGKEILSKFGYSEPEVGIAALNSYCSILNKTLPTLDGRVSLNMSNSLWTVSDPVPSFLSTLTENYMGEWICESPAGESGKEAVNKYVAKNTDNMITEFLNAPFDSDVMLLNTVYFNGKWKQEFDSELTKPGKFRNIDGKEVTTPFMTVESSFDAFGDDNVTAVEFPYGSGNFAMTLLMPADGSSFADFRHKLSASYLDEVITDMHPVSCTVSLPKFKTDARFDLEENLQKMGFKKIFDSEYDNLIKRGSVRMNKFLHAAAIEVDEKGTKAAAATYIGGETSVGPGSMIRFDSPFIYIIRETSTNTILFAGQITKF